MNYEQKYKEALERAKDCYVNKRFSELEDTPKDVCEYIFPELCESEDERILNELLDHCNTENATWYNFLKSLRPQPKIEWSEEDEDKLEQCIRIISGWEGDYDIVKSPYSNFLKSLRPDSYKNCNSRWKPSEEQMEAPRGVPPIESIQK